MRMLYSDALLLTILFFIALIHWHCVRQEAKLSLAKIADRTASQQTTETI